MKKAIYLMVFAMGMLIAGSSIMLTGCTKEGPQGLAGKDGTNGTNGVDGADGTAGCITCHKKDGIELVATQYELSKHNFGEAAFDEAGSVGCTVCHASEGFKYVVEHNTPSTFTLNTTTNKYVNDYATDITATYGRITCSTCHSSLHTTYTSADLPALTTVAPVSMTMWAGAQTIDLPADGHIGNLCVKCHQPRPFVNALTTNVLDYASLVSNPTGIIYDGTAESPNITDIIRPSYRTHTHYGTVGAIYAGKGGVEFGSGYSNSAHTTVAACQDCHMATMSGRSGGHTFYAIGNFNGCNKAGCHDASPISATSTKFTTPRAAVKTLLTQLAAKLTIGGVEIMNRNGDATSNLWFGITPNNYDGYLNVYDPITNPSGQTYNASSFKFTGNVPASWSQAQKDYNATLPVITLTNAQMGAIINFQLCLREYSLGIHNTAYTTTLLTNTIAALL